MKVTELINKLTPFAKADLEAEPSVLITVNPDQAVGGVMPIAPDTVRIWEMNGTAYVLIYKNPKE